MFWQRVKKGFLLGVVSLVLVLPLAGILSQPVPALADNHEANAGTQTPSAPKADEGGLLSDLTDAVSSGFVGVVNLFVLMFIQIIIKFIQFLGYLFSVVIAGLDMVVKYNGFSTQESVGIAWQIVRDLINSFFIVVLIAIAISTIIRFQPYNFRSTLPRLILAALLVNFSKSICLLAISFANAVMATFSQALSEILPVYALGLRLPALTAFDSSSVGNLIADAATKETVEMLNILLTSVLGLVMLAFALGGIVMFFIILLFRIIVLWFLIILSPLAFFLWGVPGRGSRYWGQWLEEFIKHLIVGPVGAFFLYIIAVFYVANIQETYGLSLTKDFGTQGGALSLAATPNVLIGYLISLGMMFIALEIVEQFGVRGGQFARDIGIEGIAKGRYAKKIASGAGAVASFANDWAYSKGLPSYRGTGLSAIREGWSARREEWVKKGKALDTARAVEYAESGSQFRALLAAASSGNVEYFKKNGIIDVMGHTLKAPVRAIQGMRGKLDTANSLENQIKSVENTDAAVNFANALATSNPALASILSQTTMQELKDYDPSLAQQSMQQLDSRISQRQAASTTEQARIAQQIAQKQQQIESNRRFGVSTTQEEQQLAQLQTDATQAQAQATQEIAQLQANRQSVEAQDRMMQDAKKMFGEDGIGIAGNSTIGSFTSAAGTTEAKASRAQAKSNAQEGLIGISKDVATARGGLQGSVTKSMREYMGESYEKDVRYSKEDLVARAKGNTNFGDRFQLGGDLLKAAEQGLFDDMVVELMGDPNFVVDHAGIKKFVNDVLIKQANMTEQEAMQVIVEIEGRNRSDNKVAQTGFVKRYGGGRLAMTSEAEHLSSVKKSLDKKDVLSILQKSRPDGLGHKQNGQLVFNQGVLDALKTKQANLSATIENRNQRTTIDEATLKMIRAAHAAGELSDLSDEAVARLNEI